MKKVLFVCTGNTCRSPLAEVVFRDLVKGRSDYAVESAGVGAFEGQCASQHSATLARELGLDLLSHKSSRLDAKRVGEATHVVGLSRGHVETIIRFFPEAEEKVYLVSEFAADDGIRGQDIADPFGGDLDDYREMLENLQLCLPSLLAYIEKTWKGDGSGE